MRPLPYSSCYQGKDVRNRDRCVNALSWANGGELLLSGGDDTTYVSNPTTDNLNSAYYMLAFRVRIWAMRQGEQDLDQEYPFVCNTEINTGHVGNIFAVQMLPSSSRM